MKPIKRMAYIGEGEGAPVVFQHGNPTSSYLWPNVMPACTGFGRLVACDLIGMGDSEKLPDSGPDSYSYLEHREYLFALWERLGIEDDVVLVVHDWDSMLSFDWARQHPDRVQGIAYMEAAPLPIIADDFSDEFTREAFQGFQSETGEELVLNQNMLVEAILIEAEKDNLSEADKAECRQPFLQAGEDRRPTLSWPRQIPLGGTPEELVQIWEEVSKWLGASTTPKLRVRGEAGIVMSGRQAAFCEALANQTEVTVEGGHFLQESSGSEIGRAVADFLRQLR